MPYFSTLLKLCVSSYFPTFPKVMCLVVFKIHLNHVSSLVVLPKMTGETALVRSDKRRQREKERNGRKERNE